MVELLTDDMVPDVDDRFRGLDESESSCMRM